MKKCPFCAEEIQDAAVVCKHCGRDLVPTAPSAVRPAPAEDHRGRTALLILIGFVLLAAFIGNRINSQSTPSSTSRKTLNVRVQPSLTAIEITNVGSGDAAGRELVVYINGNPPFTYKATATVPPIGQSVRIPLITFVEKDGTRFNPIAKAVTVVWVGGGGYDYQSFGK